MMTMMTADSDVFFGNMRNSLLLPSCGFMRRKLMRLHALRRHRKTPSLGYGCGPKRCICNRPFISKHTVSTYISFEQIIWSIETTQTHTNKRYSRGTLFQTDQLTQEEAAAAAAAAAAAEGEGETA